MNRSINWWIPAWFVLILTFWTARNLPWHLDNYDQARHAYASYEMIGQDAWWYQHTPRQRAATKPPLASWMSAGFYQVTGSWPWAWRLPSLLGGLAILIMLWKSGHLLAGTAGALLATAVFSWNLVALRLATLVRTDMLLTFFIFGAGWLIWQRIRAQEKWTICDTLGLTLLFSGAAMTKGPIFHAFLSGGLVAWTILAPKNPSKRPIFLAYLIASLVSILPFLAWAGVRMQTDPAFFDQVVVHEFFGRFTTGESAVHNNQPFYFYFLHLLTKAAPWSLCFVGVFLIKEVRQSLRQNPATLWLLCWTLSGLLIMSIVPSKRVDRIFPIIAPAALFLAAVLPIVAARFTHWKRILAIITSLAVAGYGGYAIHEVRQGYQTQRDALVTLGNSVRQLCDANRWNLVLIEGPDEGLILYAGEKRFYNLRQAVTGLRENTWQAALVDSKKLPRLIEQAGKMETLLEIPSPTRKGLRYYLVKPAPSQPDKPRSEAKVRFRSHLLTRGHNPANCPSCIMPKADF